MINPEVRQFGNILKQTRIEQDGSIKRTVIEYFPVHIARVAKGAVKKIGGDAAQLVKEIPWENHMLQNIIATSIWCVSGGIPWLVAHKNNLEARVHAFEAAFSSFLAQPAAESKSAASETLVFAPTVIPTEVSIEIRPEEIKSETQEPSYGVYKVQRGDTLFSLARRFGTSVEVIMEDNLWIGDRNTIHVGNELKIRQDTSPETLSHRTIIGKQEIRGLTEKEVSFINWLNSTHFKWRDWNGHEQRVFVPYWIYQLAKAAEEASGGRCFWAHLVAIGLTETGFFNGSQWDWEAVSKASAKGVMQFMPGTFPVYATHEGADREDPIDNMMAAANMIIYLRLPEAKNMKEWRSYFAIEKPIWNRHSDQAENSWQLLVKLREYEEMFEGMYEKVVNE